jgi:hypothetical protein
VFVVVVVFVVQFAAGGRAFVETAFVARGGAFLATGLRPSELAATAADRRHVGVVALHVDAAQRRTLDAATVAAFFTVGAAGVFFILCEGFAAGEAKLLSGKGNRRYLGVGFRAILGRRVCGVATTAANESRDSAE